jgi:tRNA nucleotidyltransferase (CCA-adding enzyme)
LKTNFKQKPKIVVISHSYADFDAIASTIAITKLFPEASPVINQTTEKEVQRFLTIYKDYFGFLELDEISFEATEKVVLVDFQDFSKIKPLQEELKKRPIDIEIYDHHPHENPFHIKKCHIKPYGSTTTILYEILKKRKVTLHPIESTLFLIGVYEDTGALTFSSTKVKDIEAAAYFLKNGAKLNVISEFVFPPIDDGQKNLFSELFNSIQKFDFKGVQIAVTAVESKKYVNGVSFLSHRIMDTLEVDAFFSVVRFKEKVLIVGRSRDENVLAIGKVLEIFGGGGHPQAGSAFIERDNGELDSIVMELLSTIKKHIKISKLVSDFMTKPVKVVSPNTSAEETLKIMLRYGHSGLPVVDNNKLVGIISRNDIGRINEESLIQRPVKSYMTRNPITITPETPIKEAEKLMVEKEIGRLPVIFNHAIVGIVTRTDLLRALYGIKKKAQRRSRKLNDFPSREEMQYLIQHSIPNSILEKMNILGKTADEMGIKIYLVGGSVRDILLSEKPNDYDFLLEGSSELFAEKLEKEKGFEILQNKNFHTAKIFFSDAMRFDIASSRTEYYEHPADLPTVVKGSLREDLFRRDFTINTLAVSLNKQDHGTLINYYHGYEDLKNKKIRFLHNLSFIEDPSRIFRAISYALKFKFTIEPDTKEAAINAMKSGIFHRTSKFRILSEFINMLNENIPISKGIKMLNDLHAIALLSENIQINQTVMDLMNQLDVLLPDFEFQHKWILYFIVLTLPLSDIEVNELAERLKLNQKKKTMMMHLRKNYHHCLLTIEKLVENSEIYQLLRSYEEEELIILTAMLPENIQCKIKKYYKELRYIKLSCNGFDIAMISSLTKENLGLLIHELLMMKLDGKILTKDDEEKQIKCYLERIHNERQTEH